MAMTAGRLTVSTSTSSSSSMAPHIDVRSPRTAARVVNKTLDKIHHTFRDRFKEDTRDSILKAREFSGKILSAFQILPQGKSGIFTLFFSNYVKQLYAEFNSDEAKKYNSFLLDETQTLEQLLKTTVLYPINRIVTPTPHQRYTFNKLPLYLPKSQLVGLIPKEFIIGERLGGLLTFSYTVINPAAPAATSSSSSTVHYIEQTTKSLTFRIEVSFKEAGQAPLIMYLQATGSRSEDMKTKKKVTDKQDFGFVLIADAWNNISMCMIENAIDGEKLRELRERIQTHLSTVPKVAIKKIKITELATLLDKLNPFGTLRTLTEPIIEEAIKEGNLPDFSRIRPSTSSGDSKEKASDETPPVSPHALPTLRVDPNEKAVGGEDSSPPLSPDSDWNKLDYKDLCVEFSLV